VSIREEKGRQIAERSNIVRDGHLWLVPSQSGKGKYKVNPEAKRCTCPDYDFRREPCKHIYAVERVIERQKVTTTDAQGVTTTTTTTTEKVTLRRKTYRQEWPAYNAAQTQEKRLFLYLLHQLCQGVGSPAQNGPGQRRLPLEDMIFAMAYKVYSTVSGRRFMTDLRDAHAKGYIENLPCYNSIFNYFESEMLTPHLLMLIEESARPLAAIEQDFAADSSGLSTGVYQRWSEAKWGKARMLFGEMQPNQVSRKDWLKIHIMTGVKTNVVTAVEVTDAHANDSRFFKPLVEATAQNFTMRQVSADKAYLSGPNLKAVVDNHAMPYIPFKANSTGQSGSPLFKKMFHFYSYNSERFMQNYHKRSNVESTFHMIKSKFGNGLRSKTRTAQINEALCKILCHNLCCLIQSMFELNLRPKFWAEAA
jgi:transposase/predicted nucleic acid-binding Zn finger protein